MNHPNRICFTCDVAATSGSVYGSGYTVELVDLMSMMDKEQRLACKGGHQYIAHFLHGSTILFVGIVYFPQYVDDDEFRFRCLKSLSQKLTTFMSKNIKPSRVVLRVKEVQVIWEADPGGRQVTHAFSPDSLTRIELEIENVRPSALPVQEGAPRSYRMRYL